MTTFIPFYCPCTPFPNPDDHLLPQLHNVFLCEFSDGTNTFHSMDQYIQWRKAVLFGDADIAAQILATPYLNMTMWRVLGRRIQNFDSATWREAAPLIGKEGNLLKFQQNPELRTVLLGTGDSILVCQNFYDRYWGAGVPNSEALDKPEEWVGFNWCGNVLMEVRSELATMG